MTSERRSAPPAPRWVKVFGIVGVVLLVLIAFILVTGLGGPHGPSRHGGSVDAVWQTAFGAGEAARPILDDGLGVGLQRLMAVA